MATLDLGKLGFEIGVETSGLDKGLADAKRRVTDFEKQLDSAGKKKLAPVVDATQITKLDTSLGKVSQSASKLSSSRINPTADTAGLDRLQSAVQSAERSSDELSKKKIRPDVDESGVDQGFKSIVGKAAGAAAAVGAAFSVIDFGRGVLQAGNEFQSQMNTLTAVSGASAQQLALVQAKARELGSATDLTATSASDAAAAMTELAKGGFTVDQAMSAAKGTLQLASAAQLDAAQAATIQSQALQAFGLGAEHAARVSDILAGAANASSAEMTGIAQGMQQAGTVSKQFGLTIEDTATALAMFANAGIQGSDAGTLLKTAMLALTDQGKPAQQAIEQLGLTVYDANGKFVGMSSLMEQLQVASQNMTEEQYQAATATLFGSDAMRMAGIAAQQGSEGFDSLKEAVTRQGQAAEVAAAQTQGLPGALERWQNTIEDLQLGVFDAMQDELVGLANAGVDMVDALQPAIEGVAKAAAGAAGDVLQFVTAVAQAPQSVKDVTVGLGEFAAILAVLNSSPAHMVFEKMSNGAKTAKGALSGVAEAAREASVQYGAQAMVLRDTAREQSVLAKTADTATARSNAFWAAHDARWAAGAATAKAHGAAIGGALQHIGGSAKAGLGSVVAMLGGPWMVGFAAAATAVTAFVSAGKAVDEANQRIEDSSRKAAEAQRELALAASGTEGILSGDALSAAEQMVDGALANITAKGEAANKVFGSVRSAIDEVGVGTFLLQGITSDATAEYQSALDAARGLGDQQKALSDALRDTGLTMDDVNRVVAEGGPEYDRLVESLRGMGPQGEAVADSLGQVRDEIERTAQAGRELPENYVQAARAIDLLADSATSAEDKLAAMDALMVAMGLRPKDAERAMLDFKESLDKTGQEIEMITRSSDFMGQAMFDASGKLQLEGANQATVELQKKIDGLATDLERAALKGADMDDAMANMEPTLQAIQQAWGLTDQQMEGIRDNLREIAGTSTFAVQLQGADEATQELSAILAMLKGAEEDQHEIRMDMPSEHVMAALDEMGVAVNDLGNGKVSIPVTAETREAIDQLQEVAWVADEAASKGVTIDALLNTDQLEGSAAHAQEILGILAIQNPSPEADVIIQKLLNGVDVSHGELAALAAVSSVPTADLEAKLLHAGVDGANRALGTIPKSTNTDLKGNANNVVTEAGRAKNSVNSVPSEKTVTFWARLRGAWDAIRGHFNGGVVGFHAGGLVPGFADGGFIPNIPGISDTERDPILGIDSTGVPVARIEPREYVVNRAATEKNLPLLHDINAGRVSMEDLPGYADGGVVSPAQLLAFAGGKTVNGKTAPRSLEGATYVWGGGLLGNWGDCSGAMSGLAAMAVGMPLQGRKFATGNEGSVLSSMGFSSGLGSGPRFAVGWFNGGPYGGHTAGTIYGADGTRVNVEMGGGRGNGQIGGRAAGADHSSFTNRAYLPLMGPGSGDITDPGSYGGGGGEVVNTSTDSVTMKKAGKTRKVDWGTASQLASDVEARNHKYKQLARYNAGLYDKGGILRDGQIAVNMSGHDEYVIPPALTNAIVTYLPQYAEALPGVTKALNDFTTLGNQVAGAGMNRAALTQVGWNTTLQARADLQNLPADASPFDRWAIYANRTAGEALMGAASMSNSQWIEAGEKLGLDFLGEYAGGIARAQEEIEDSYVAQVDAADALVEAEANLADAQRELNEVMEGAPELSKATARKVEDAERKVEEARKGGDAKKLADAERNLARVREDAAEELEKNGAKDAQAILDARQAVTAAEADLTTAQGVVQAAAVATGQAQIAMAVEVASVVIKLTKKVAKVVKKVVEAERAARVGAAEVHAQIMANVRDLTEATEQQRRVVGGLMADMVRMKLQVLDSTWKVRQAQNSVWTAHLEGLVGIRKAEAALQAERDKLAGKQHYNFVGLDIEYDRLIGNIQSGLLDIEASEQDMLDMSTAAMVARIRGEQGLSDAYGDAMAQRLRTTKNLTKEEARLVSAVFAGRFAGYNDETASLEQRRAYASAYYSMQKAGLEGLMEQATRTSAELQALEALRSAAQWEREKNVLAMQLDSLEATYSQHEAVKQLARLGRDFNDEVARYNRLQSGAMGMQSDEAIIKAEIARLQAENAQARKDIKDTNLRALWDVNKDGRFVGIQSESSLKNQAAKATIAANEELLLELTDRLAAMGKDVEPLSKEDERIIEMAGMLRAKGENERADQLMRSTSYGKARDVQLLDDIDSRVADIARERKDTYDGLVDAMDERAYQEQRLPLDMQRYYAEGMEASYRSDAEGYREADGATRDAWWNLADWQREYAGAAADMSNRNPDSMMMRLNVQNERGAARNQTLIRMDLTQGALMHSDDVEAAFKRLASEMDGVKIDVRQLQRAGAPTGKTVQLKRAGIR